MHIILVNRKAYREYEIQEKHDAGVRLFGYEVKALREGRGNLRGSYIKIFDDQLYLVGMDIPKYSKAGEIFEYDSKRTRLLLVHKHEIEKIKVQIQNKGLTAVPLKVYLDHNLIKLLFGIGRGKKKENIKQELIKRQDELEMRRILKAQNRGFA